MAFREVVLRKGKTARNFKPGKHDHGSTRLIIFAFGIALVIAPIFDSLGIGQLTHFVFIRWIGIVMIITGTIIDSMAMKTLGIFFTRTLTITKEHRIVKQGLYKIIRHPGYLGSLIIWSGFGVSTANWIAAAIIFTMMFFIYVYRINSEEAMLINNFGDKYKKYMTRTWRLIPFIY